MSPLGVTDIALAVVLGSAFGLGVCLLVSLTPRWGAPSWRAGSHRTSAM